MLIKIEVKATGHGLGYNKYDTEFSFSMNVPNDYEDDDGELERIAERVRREAQKKTCCNYLR